MNTQKQPAEVYYNKLLLNISQMTQKKPMPVSFLIKLHVSGLQIY